MKQFISIIAFICFCLLLAESTVGAANSSFPFAPGNLDAYSKPAAWTWDDVRMHRDLTVGNLNGLTKGWELDNAANAQLLGYTSPKVETKTFEAELDLREFTGFFQMAIHVDDIAVLDIEEIQEEGAAEGLAPIKKTYTVNGGALWRTNQSYKEFHDCLPASRKYKLLLTYKNTINLTAKNPSGYIDYDGVNVFLVPVSIDLITPNKDAQGNPIDSELIVAKELRIAKWENAIMGRAGDPSLRDDFIEWDKDRFYVRIVNGANSGVESIRLATKDCPDPSYNDDATMVPLAQVGNDLISDSMILVSDDIDDDYAENGAGHDDADGDRTHKVQLQGKVAIKKITISGKSYDIEVNVPVPAKKKLNIDFIRMNSDGNFTAEQVNDAIKYVQERYAQAALLIVANHQFLAWPQQVEDLKPAGYPMGAGRFSALTDGKVNDLHKAFIDNTDIAGVNLYFLLQGYSSAGLAISEKQILVQSGDLEMKYINKAYINKLFNGGSGTAAHELMHLLSPGPAGVDDHGTVKFYNLLMIPHRANVGTIYDRRRINSQQEANIYSHPDVTNL